MYSKLETISLTYKTTRVEFLSISAPWRSRIINTALNDLWSRALSTGKREPQTSLKEEENKSETIGQNFGARGSLGKAVCHRRGTHLTVLLPRGQAAAEGAATWSLSLFPRSMEDWLWALNHGIPRQQMWVLTGHTAETQLQGFQCPSKKRHLGSHCSSS